MELPTFLQEIPLPALAALLAGILILVVPRVLNYAVAAYLLVIGVLGVMHFVSGQRIRPQAVIALVAGILILIRPNILAIIVGIYLIVVGLLEWGILRV